MINPKARLRVRNLSIASLLTAIGILIPLMMPAKIVIGPASFTLASHVPVMAALFFSPWMAGFVAIATTVGFLVSLPVPIIWMRAGTHILAMGLFAVILRRYPAILEKQWRLQAFNFALAILHAGLEALVVVAFYQSGAGQIAPAAYNSLLALVFFGGIIHSMVDFNLAYGFCKVLNKIYAVDLLKKKPVEI